MRKLSISALIVILLGSLFVFQSSFVQLDSVLDHIGTMEPSHNTSFVTTENYEEMNLSSLDLSLYLNETNATVIGSMTIDFFNSDPVVFSSIPFHLYLSGMQSYGRPGNITIQHVNELTPSPVPLMFDVYAADQLMWVHLNEDLQPNSSVVLEIDFISVLPTDAYDRGGVSGTDMNSSKIFEFASAYPIPCVYDEYDGWNTDPYLGVGDPFYFDMAYYTFNVAIPNGFVVAATGEVTDTDVGATHTTYHYTPSRPVREITFCASRYYIIESQNYQGVNVTAYYLPESLSLWASNGLAWGVRSLALYNDTFGLYPYSTLNIVEDYGPYYGMEYPCQVYMSNIITDRFLASQITADTLDAVIAHEVAHQWWYHLVGNDQIDAGFIDEGLTCWSVYYYSEFYGLGWPGKTNDFDAVRTTYPARINQSIYDDSTTYYFTAYTKTPVVLEKLRQIIGTTDFLQSLRLFFTRLSFRIAFLQDLQSAFEDHCGVDLDWFFTPMFDNEYLPDYAFQSAEYYESTNILVVTIEDQNEALHVANYIQNFSIEILTTDDEFTYPSIQLNGTTELLLHLPDDSTGYPTRISLLYDDFSLVQLDNPLLRFISTSNITAGPTPSPVTWDNPPPEPWVWTDLMTLSLIAGAAVGLIVLAIVIVLLKKKEP